MTWAPDSRESWTVFAAGMVVLYAGIIFLVTPNGILDSAAYGVLLGLVMAALVWVAITLWRAVKSSVASPE